MNIAYNVGFRKKRKLQACYTLFELEFQHSVDTDTQTRAHFNKSTCQF